MTGAKTDALNLALHEPLLCRFGGLCQQTHIHNLVRDLLLDDQLVFGIDSDLRTLPCVSRSFAGSAVCASRPYPQLGS
jgi:hypothetical protein